MRFGGNTFSYMWNTPVLDALAELLDIGLNDFDVIVSPGHLWPMEMKPFQLATLRQELNAMGARLESLNPPALDYNLGSLVVDVREAAVEMYSSTIRAAAELGAKGVVVVPGRVSGLFPPPVEMTREALYESIGELAELAKSLQMRLHIETHPLTSMPTAEGVKSFIDALRSTSLGVAYDLSNAEFIGEDQATAIRRLGPLLSQIHISDGTRQSWRHDAIGEGSVDFGSALAAAEEIGFKGVAIIELISHSPRAAYEKSLSMIMGVGD